MGTLFFISKPTPPTAPEDNVETAERIWKDMTTPEPEELKPEPKVLSVYDIMGNKMGIDHFIMSAYLYYAGEYPEDGISPHGSVSVLDDLEYDQLFKWIKQEWDSLEHPLKYLIDNTASDSSMCHQLPFIPKEFKLCALKWYDQYEKFLNEWQENIICP